MKLGKYFFLLLFFLIISGCATTNENVISNQQEFKERSSSIELKEQIPIEKQITISAIGDVLIHEPVYQDAKNRNENGYNFGPMFQYIKPYLEDATITIANQESMIGGTEMGLSTYPSFNSPFEVGDALKEVGVDVVTLANNHTLDRGEAAIQNAIKHWETIDMMYTGSYKNELDNENIRVYETGEGISVAFLSYTYGTNGIPVPSEKDYLVNLIDKETIKKDVASAKKQADAIVLNLHFGNENERMPNESQKELVQFAADQGVHAVIGHHPHVLQPMEYVTGKNGNETFVMYSLGNFLSNQQDLYQRIGGILTFSITKTVTGDEQEIKVDSPKFLPTYVTFTEDFSDYEVKPLHQVSNAELSGSAKHYEEIKAHLSQWMPELEFIEG